MKDHNFIAKSKSFVKYMSWVDSKFQSQIKRKCRVKNKKK